MKRFFIFICSICVAPTAFAQNWSGATPGDIFYNSGNIGIGTSSPEQKLSVSSNANVFFLIEKPQYLDKFIFGISTHAGIINYSAGDPLNSQLRFQTNSYTRLTIDNAGKIGIGTGTPVDKLTLDEGNITLGNTSNQEYNIVFRPSDNSWRSALVGYSSNTVANDYIGLRTLYGSIRFITNNGSEVVRITDSEKMGIGTATPEEKLHVNGTTTIAGDIGVPGDSHWKTGNHTLELTNSDGGDVVLSFHRQGYSNASISTSSSMGLIFTGNGAANANHLHILKDGQVGIGTSSVGTHRLAVEGSIGAREVRVEATGWSDYVFAPDYALRSLGEVEQFISENQHLPGIPSALEVEEHGINLGEMDAKLLEKIEELTLYLIEQNKQLANQQKEIENLKLMLNQLKKP